LLATFGTRTTTKYTHRRDDNLLKMYSEVGVFLADSDRGVFPPLMSLVAAAETVLFIRISLFAMILSPSGVALITRTNRGIT